MKIQSLMKTSFSCQTGLRRQKNSAGFTLVEVMVAVMVVSVAISAILTRIITTADSTARLRDKAIANWVALNQMELLYIANENPNSRTYNTLLNKTITGREEMAGRRWYWQIKPLKGVSEGSVPVQVTVSDNENGDSPIVTLLGAIDAFHASQ